MPKKIRKPFPKREQTMVYLGVRVKESDLEEMEAIAKREKITISEFVRVAIAEAIQNYR